MEHTCNRRKRRGWIFLGIGGLILMGTLHLDFLIPLIIGGVLVAKGWKMLKQNGGGHWWEHSNTNTYPSTAPHHPVSNFDALDEWEKQLHNKK